MTSINHWFVCLDLSKMDDILIGYTHFLTSFVQPETITFLHVIESSPATEELIDLFPEIKEKEDIEKIIRKELTKKIKPHFENSDTEIRVIIKDGRPTSEIISIVNSMEADFLIVGKKTGYVGEGVTARRIVKYVPVSVMFVPETSRYSMKKAVVPIDFSDQSARALKRAMLLMDKTSGEITAQHIYKYPSHYFPYMQSEEDKQRVDDHLDDLKNEFIRKHNIGDDVKFVFTLHKEGKIADLVYDQIVQDQADLLVTGAKSNKKVARFLRDDFTDKMTYYSFGIPLLIQKDKERHQKLLDKFFASTS